MHGEEAIRRLIYPERKTLTKVRISYFGSIILHYQFSRLVEIKNLQKYSARIQGLKRLSRSFAGRPL